jgi:amino acid transporter
LNNLNPYTIHDKRDCNLPNQATGRLHAGLAAILSAPALKRELRLWDLVFLNITAVASVRWIGAAAHTGPGSISLWLLAAVAFFVPSALVVAALGRRFPEEGGFYIWTKRAFGDWHGFLCAWLYFISNLLFLPSLALAGVALSAYVWNADPGQLAQNRPYTLAGSLCLLWGAFLANLFGLKIEKWAGNLGAIGTYISFAVLVAAAGWIAMRYGSVTRFHMLPAANWDGLNTWSQIAFAFVGLELGPILGGEILDPFRNVPRAAWISAAGCVLFYIAGTAAVLVLMPAAQVSQVTGIAQAGVSAAARLGLLTFSPFFAALVVAGTFGSLGSWVAGNTRLPFVIGLDRHLPRMFARLHPRWSTPYVSILWQATVSTIFLAATQAGETLAAAYQILIDMTVITTFLPYLYIFAVGWKYGQRIAGAFGLSISMLAITLSMVPPPEVASRAVFELKVMGGCALLSVLGWLVFSSNMRKAAVL